MVYTTTLKKASTRGNSLRTTVPSGIVKAFGLKDGDKLEWEIIAKDNDLMIIVRPKITQGNAHEK